MSAEKDFERAVREQLKHRARIVRGTEAEVKSLLARALEKVLGILADQPTDYQLWSLPQLVKEIGAVASELGDTATAAAARAAQETWAAGVDLVVKPLDLAGLAAAADVAPRIAARQLMAMKHFMADKMKDVSLAAANQINGQLGLVVIGAQSPYEAQRAIRGILKERSASRAATIVRTELLRVYSTASHEAMTAAAAAGAQMDKVWRRSGKTHPRLSHAMADGQRVAHDKPFLIGGVKMMHPHDPAAPAKETINCGCVSVPKPRGWKSTLPDHKPFTADELARNPTLKAVAEGRAAGEPTLRELLAKQKSDFASGGKMSGMASPTLPAATLAKLDGDAQAYVLGNGRKTGHEYLYAFDAATGKVLAQRTDGQIDNVSMPADLKAAALDRTRQLVIHHNHPDSSPFSAKDMTSLGDYAGILSATAHGHDGSLWRVIPEERGNIVKALAAFQDPIRRFSRAEAGTLRDADLEWVNAAARLRALDQAGIVRLETNIDWAAHPLVAQVEKLAKLLYADAIKLKPIAKP